MELLGFSFLVILLFIFSLLILLVNKFKTSDTSSNLPPPPGPSKLPVIGNLHQLVCSLPHHRLRDLANKYGPLMLLQLGEVATIVVSSPQVAKEVMKTHDVIFASRPRVQTIQIMSSSCDDIIFSPYGEYWRQIRKICVSELLSTKRVQSFRSTREEEVLDLINWISSNGGSVINLTEKVYSLMYSITSRAAFGNRSRDDQEAFASIIEKLSRLVSGFSIADLFPSFGLLQWITGIRFHAKRLRRESEKIVEKIINDHKNHNNTSDEDHQDLVDILLKIQEQGNLEFPLTTDRIKAVVSDIFGAGSETSATTIDWAMCEMIKNPRVMEKAQAEVRKVFNKKGKVDETSIDEMKYLKLIVKETLRLHPAGPLLIPRECGERCEINGFNIPLKSRVIVNAWAIGRDPKYWTEPAEGFIPERFIDNSVDYKGTNFEYIPFGAGRRICPGMSFGLASVELPLAMFLYYFDWKLPNGMKHEDLDMTEIFGVTVRRKKDLCMIPIPYQPSSDP